jgi:hypothetical protein
MVNVETRASRQSSATAKQSIDQLLRCGITRGPTVAAGWRRFRRGARMPRREPHKRNREQVAGAGAEATGITQDQLLIWVAIYLAYPGKRATFGRPPATTPFATHPRSATPYVYLCHDPSAGCALEKRTRRPSLSERAEPRYRVMPGRMKEEAGRTTRSPAVIGLLSASWRFRHLRADDPAQACPRPHLRVAPNMIAAATP